MMKEKTKQLYSTKYFIPCMLFLINIALFVICNLLVELRYDEIDDFTMMNIISNSDGSYSFYSIYMHPLMSALIVLLYKTGINVNWYTIVLLGFQILSFTIVETILIKKDVKLGAIACLLLSVLYLKTLVRIQYTITATIVLTAGFIWLMYNREHKQDKKQMLLSLCLIALGIMIRKESFMLVCLFYVVWVVYAIARHRNGNIIKEAAAVILLYVAIIASYYGIYHSDPTYQKYTEFNEVRTYFFDKKMVEYENNKEAFDKIGWSYNDYRMLYSYSMTDEEVYNTENLQQLKENVQANETSAEMMNKGIRTVITTWTVMCQYFTISSILMCLLLLYAVAFKKNGKIVVSIFLLHICLMTACVWTKLVYRVIVSLYIVSMSMMLYFIISKEEQKEQEERKNKLLQWMFLVVFLMITIVAYFGSVANASFYHQKNYSYIREVTQYTKEHPENAYVYTTALNDIYLSYPVYERIGAGDLANFRKLSDWDIYDREYYEFKDRYHLTNIMKDLYEKDNVYVVTGRVRCRDNKIDSENIEAMKTYIEEHYHKKVNYRIVKEFKNDIKVYQLYEIK